MLLGTHKKECKRGHLFDDVNTLILKNGVYVCIKCQKIREEKYLLSPHAKEQRNVAVTKSREKTRPAIRARWKVRKEKGRKFVDKLKTSSPCLDCKQYFSSYVMDYDHVRGEKKRGISGLIDGGYTLKAIIEEIDKCELVCANCHRERTHQRRIANAQVR